MRLAGFEIRKTGPLKRVAVDNLANVVVFAGPNGVGKTNLVNGLINHARSPHAGGQTWMMIEATNEAERSAWGKGTLDTRDPKDAELFGALLYKNQKRNRYRSSILNFDSDRSVQNIQHFSYSWDISSPFMEEIGWDLGLQSLSNRYNDVRHSLFRLVQSQRNDIADAAMKLSSSGEDTMSLDFPDVIAPFKTAFYQLLAPKKLTRIDARSQDIFYEINGQEFSISTLSSGEREVVNIVFDFLLRNPEDCIVVFDEPELHLHPELSYKLLQTLSSIGKRNQFLFSTHSPEIISASLENTVVFVTPAKGDEDNQAIVVHRDDDTHHALQALGQSIGIISLGKKIILVEGDESSLDKQTYGAILKARYPEFVLVPVGGKGSLRSFDEVRDQILSKTIWGVDFFLLCDRDAVNSLGPKALASTDSKRVTVLPRYHLENYFLDSHVFTEAFGSMEPEGSWLRSEIAIEAKLREFAASVVPYAVALNVSATVRETIGNVSLMPKGCSGPLGSEEVWTLIHAKLTTESERVHAGLDVPFIQNLVHEEFKRLTASVADGSDLWISELPGRPIFNRFASAANLQPGRLKQLYLAHADVDDTFREVVDIFESFRSEFQ